MNRTPQLLRPLSESLSNAVVSEADGVATIVHVGRFTRPSTIAWFIVAICVYAVYLHSFWTRPHVGVEVFKLQPSFAYLNSPPTVKVVADIGGIRASISHIRPYVVFAGIAHVVSGLAFSDQFAPFATAGFGGPASEVLREVRNFLSAVASAKPPNVLASRGYAKNGEIPDFLTSKVNHK